MFVTTRNTVKFSSNFKSKSKHRSDYKEAINQRAATCCAKSARIDFFDITLSARLSKKEGRNSTLFMQRRVHPRARESALFSQGKIVFTPWLKAGWMTKTWIYFCAIFGTFLLLQLLLYWFNFFYCVKTSNFYDNAR